MGDRKPIQNLRHLRCLGGNTVGDNLLRTIWTNRRLSMVQRHLVTQKALSLDEVAELADHVLEATSIYAQFHAVSTPALVLEFGLIS